jgi:glutamate formiminotransferase / formiminotetrahydrofolate cyclodeaminase
MNSVLTEGLAECVMNVSEGRDERVLSQLQEEIESQPGCVLLGCSADVDHNRAVLTFVGAPGPLLECSFRVVGKAVDLIDLRRHTGVHPRIGAVDVVPFVPLEDTSMEVCIRMARELGTRVATAFELPVFLYEEAARTPGGRSLPAIRKGGLEALEQEIQRDILRAPDCGPRRLHPSAGAIAIGARRLLIAFNVHLDSADPAFAQKIARKIRERDGGMPGVRALGFYLPSRKLVQVSMNLLDYHQTSLAAVFARILQEAESLGVGVVSSQIVGFVPASAANKETLKQLRLENREATIILEERIDQARKERVKSTHRVRETGRADR